MCSGERKMVKSIVMHQLDYNNIAACEEWYYRCHGPQIARRYGPWLARFESYRPVPLPGDIEAENFEKSSWMQQENYPFLRTYENYVCTVLLERPAFDWMKETYVYR